MIALWILGEGGAVPFNFTFILVNVLKNIVRFPTILIQLYKNGVCTLLYYNACIQKTF